MKEKELTFRIKVKTKISISHLKKLLLIMSTNLLATEFKRDLNPAKLQCNDRQ